MLLQASITNVKHIESKDFGALTDYQQVDHQFCQLKNYNLTYIMYKSVAPNGWLANGPPHWELLMHHGEATGKGMALPASNCLCYKCTALSSIHLSTDVSCLQCLRCGDDKSDPTRSNSSFYYYYYYLDVVFRHFAYLSRIIPVFRWASVQAKHKHWLQICQVCDKPR